jgi:hypothetical protein
LSPALLTIVSAAALAAAGIGVAAARRPAEAPAGLSRPVLDALGPRAYAPGTARAGAATRAAAIPLPSGGNFNGIRWELAAADIPVAQMDLVVQYNAACQWLRAWRRGSGTALGVFRRAASWTALRGSSIAGVAAEASRGGGKDVTAMLADCDASHTREVAYARRLGLTPST